MIARRDLLEFMWKPPKNSQSCIVIRLKRRIESKLIPPSLCRSAVTPKAHLLKQLVFARDECLRIYRATNKLSHARAVSSRMAGSLLKDAVFCATSSAHDQTT